MQPLRLIIAAGVRQEYSGWGCFVWKTAHDLFRPLQPTCGAPVPTSTFRKLRTTETRLVLQEAGMDRYFLRFRREKVTFFG